MTATAIPLTTVFSPAAACTTDTWYIEYLSGTYHYDTAISATDAGWWLSQGPKEWSSCFPSGYKAATDFYFSPGLCPSGYTVASQSTDSLDGNVETRATCCPSGYSAQTENGLVWYSTNRCTSTNGNSNHAWTFTKTNEISSMTTADGINAKAVFVRWQSTDFTTPTATSMGATTSTGSSTVSPTATSQDTSADGKSSKAWIAGPVIGAVFACTLVALAAIWFTRRKYKQKTNVDPAQSGLWYHKRELGGDGPAVFEAPSDTNSSPKKPLGELSAANPVSELP
ncbi:hypothetical protein N7504_011060 [Penicillium tannophilum]|nr:hypothetical protein N7504_011060 [Penicillium tannophilum]